MKKLFIMILALAALSCSTDDASALNDNCAAERAEINQRFDAQIQWVRDNTAPDDEAQISLLNEERAAALEKACN